MPHTQTALLPLAVDDYVGAQSPVRVIDEFVNGMDVVALGFAKAMSAHTGRYSYAPDTQDLL